MINRVTAKVIINRYLAILIILLFIIENTAIEYLFFREKLRCNFLREKNCFAYLYAFVSRIVC